ncbi:ABC transporter substrate-binding protein [Humitalea sp. 24SJ18S-53]|uniref:ABC transporter substrate-binding protein n=1 Tax=Humitalea sp. 24SJ18S-53 TaxID=3422307 RepID=UPI003D669503
MAPIRFALGAQPTFAALKASATLPNGAAVEWPAISPIHRAFALMARAQAYDLCEMAIVTAVQAVAYGKPIIVLPATVASRAQHRCLIRLTARPEVTPETLRGGRIGVRAYTQTTGMWVRAILAETHGVAAHEVRWTTQEGAHVAEYDDPPQVVRAPESASLLEMLDAGKLDAVILGNDLPDDPRYSPVIPDPAAAATAWAAKHGIPQVNHLVVARQDFAEAHPDDLRAAYAALRDAAGGSSALPFGAALEPALAVVLATCLDQGLLPRALSVAEVLAPARRILGQ